MHQEALREFATGDRIQFTASDKDLGIANRSLGTITHVEPEEISVRLDGKVQRTVTFDPQEMRHFEHGYVVTSHSSQGLTAERVLANIDTDSARSLINTRLAYVAISRASEDAHIYTNNAETLGERLAHDVSKTAAVEFRQSSDSEEVRQSIDALRSHRTGAATELLQQQGRIHEYAGADHRLAAVALDYAAQPDRTVVLAPDPVERQELTQLIRADLQARGTVATNSRSLPILVEQELSHPKLAASYAPGDLIQYKTGSAETHGIASNSSATVIATDPTKNLLTIETREGEQVAYNPALLKQQTAQSTMYREEARDLAEGDRIQFTKSNWEQRIRFGDFATIERIAEDNSIALRLDNGRAAELNPEKARHIDYGYVVDGNQRFSADRVLATGENLEPTALSNLSPYTRDLSIYTSGSTSIQPRASVLTKDTSLVQSLERTLPGLESFGLSR
ncbi:MAG TPA: hypothetical protein VIX90_02015 [Edaphobacter sp.]